MALLHKLVLLGAAGLLVVACGDDDDGGSDGGVAVDDGGGNGPDSRVADAGPADPACPTIALASIATPTTVVGTGTAASCSEAAFGTAVAAGGVITFDCGGPATITITSTKVLPIGRDTVIDGQGMITLAAGGSARMLRLDRGDFRFGNPVVTLQRLTFSGARATAGTGMDDGSGAAIFLSNGGALNVIDSTFTGGRAPSPGQEIGGGAMFVNGVGPVQVSGSSFSGNQGSNGGAIGIRGGALTVVGSIFDDNRATGTGGNPGNGGNGGAIVIDGAGQPVQICGTRFTSNRAGAHGGAVFRTGYETEDHIVRRSTFATNQSSDSGAALYAQGVKLVVEATTITGHTGGPAVFLANHGATPETADFTNVTIANNTTTGLGAAIFDTGITGGTIKNCTIARNHASFNVAINGGANLRMVSSIIEGSIGDNVANPNNPLACGRFVQGSGFNNPLMGGGGNLQFPRMKGGGFDDNPCTASGTTFADPLLDALADNGGLTQTMKPRAGSPAFGAGTECAATDQRGQPRPATGCTAGAVQ